jgi:hypothetical protein
MKKLFQLIILTIPLLAFGQDQELTKWIKRGSISTGELTVFAASKYIVPTGNLKYDSSYYYEGEFVILAEKFNEELFNKNSYSDIYEFDDEKCIHENGLNFIDMTNELGYNNGTRIILLPINVCSDYITGLTFEVSNNSIVKLFELEMWGDAEIKVEQINEQFYAIEYRTDEGTKAVKFDSKTKTIANRVDGREP